MTCSSSLVKSYFNIFLIASVLVHTIDGKFFLFNRYTVFQISCCLATPIDSPGPYTLGKNPGLNACVQLNYNLPFSPSEFYRPLYWEGLNARSVSNSLKIWLRNIFFKSKTKMFPTTNELEGNGTARMSPRVTKRDLSAGEFYFSLEDFFHDHGYHKDCVLKSICEMAKSPFIEDEHDGDNNILHNIIHFVLSPSVHQAFDPHEEFHQRNLFEEAERIGKENGDCDKTFPDCPESPLHHVTHVIE